MGIIEDNWLILVCAATVALVSVGITAIFGLRRSVVHLLSVGLLVRTVVCVWAWYLSSGTEYAYWTGLNEDSNRFFLNSYLPLDEAIWTTEDKGFPAINSIITAAASACGQDHYLVNVQIVLAAGALFAIATYFWVRETIGERTAKTAAWIIAFHPIVIGWSTGLMRDTLVAAFGWFMVAALLRLSRLRRKSFIPVLAAFVLSALVTWYIRNMTFAYLLGVSALMFLLGRKSLIRKGAKVSVFATLVASVAILLATTDVLERFGKSWTYGERFRSDVGVDATTVNDGGISARMAQSGSTSVYLVAAPYAFIAPFPVYATPVGASGEPGRLVDYIFNVGGLVNLFLFVLLAPALYLWYLHRRWDLLVIAGPVFWIVCVLCILGAGQSRWIMPFVYPVVAASVSYLVQNVLNRNEMASILFVFSAVAVLLFYIIYWMLKVEISIYLTALTCIPALMIVNFVLLKVVALAAHEKGAVS